MKQTASEKRGQKPRNQNGLFRAPGRLALIEITS